MSAFIGLDARVAPHAEAGGVGRGRVAVRPRPGSARDGACRHTLARHSVQSGSFFATGTLRSCT